MIFKDASKDCVTLEVTTENKISITVSEDNKSSVCEAIKTLGITTETIDLI